MIRIIFILSAILILSSCSSNKPLVAISKAKGSDSYKNYKNWIEELDPNIKAVDLYHIKREKALEILKKSSGLVLSGGPDVHPDHYGRPDEAHRCSIDLERDTLELELINYAIVNQIPILAICRGQQMMNVAFKGSLIVDIPTDYESDVVHQKKGEDALHEVIIQKDSYLYEILNKTSGTVNSNHHQGISDKELAPGFVYSAKSEDGLIEAFEYENPKSMPFMIAVAWHPERLKDTTMSNPIGYEFLKHVNQFYKKNFNTENLSGK